MKLAKRLTKEEQKRKDKTSYAKSYYYAHREELLRKKRERYANDVAYREGVIEAAKASQRRKQVPIARRKKAASDPKEVVVELKGKELTIKAYDLQQLAIALGKSVQTLRKWEDRGILPPALYRQTGGSSGIRLYPEFQFEKILEAYALTIREYGQLKVDHRIGSTDFEKRLHDIWRRYPRGLDPRVY